MTIFKPMTGNTEFEVGFNIPAKPGMNEADIQTPCLVLDLDALERNIKKMGDYAKALPLYEQSLEIKEMTLGKQHPFTATSLNNLAILDHRSICDRERGRQIEHLPIAPNTNHYVIARVCPGEVGELVPSLHNGTVCGHDDVLIEDP